MQCNKNYYRAKHPVEIEVTNDKGEQVKRYYNGHIHRMAIWRSAAKFSAYVYRQWWLLEDPVRTLKHMPEPTLFETFEEN